MSEIRRPFTRREYHHLLALREAWHRGEAYDEFDVVDRFLPWACPWPLNPAVGPPTYWMRRLAERGRVG